MPILLDQIYQTVIMVLFMFCCSIFFSAKPTDHNKLYKGWWHLKNSHQCNTKCRPYIPIDLFYFWLLLNSSAFLQIFNTTPKKNNRMQLFTSNYLRKINAVYYFNTPKHIGSFHHNVKFICCHLLKVNHCHESCDNSIAGDNTQK